MRKDEILAWYKKNEKLLTTFDIDEDGIISFHEIRWAVKTTIEWAVFASENPAIPCWLYAHQKKVLGPVVWDDLADKIPEGRVLFVKKEGVKQWLPYQLIEKVKQDGDYAEDSEESEDDPHDYREIPDETPVVASTEKHYVSSEARPPQYLQDEVVPELWSDSLYFLQKSTFLESSYSGRIFNTQGSIAQVKVDLSSESFMSRSSRYRKRSYSDVFSHGRTVFTNRVIIETMKGFPLYAIERTMWSMGFLSKFTLYDMMNPQLGMISIGSIQMNNLLFYSRARIHMDEMRLSSLSVSGPFYEQDILMGTLKAGIVKGISARDIQHIAGKSPLQKIELYRKDSFLAQAVVFSLICKGGRFWRMRKNL